MRATASSTILQDLNTAITLPRAKEWAFRRAGRTIGALARALAILLGALTLGSSWDPALAQSSAGFSEFYIPGGSDQLWGIFEDLDNDPDLVEASGIHAVIAVTTTADGTTVYYDHWEDGYDFDPLNPALTADESYFPVDTGDVLEFESSNIPQPRGTGDCAVLPAAGFGCYDGRDRIFVAGGPVSVTRASWPESIGTVFSLAWEIYPTKPFLTNYTIPVGEDLDAGSGYNDFANVYVIVQSTTDGNNVQIDDPGSPGVEVNVTLNRGEVTELYHIDAETTVVANDPVQVQFMVGDFASGDASEIRGYSAVPDSLWDNEYYSSVPSAASGNTDLYFYNPNASTISIDFEDLSGSGSFTIPAGVTIAYSDAAGAGRFVPQNSGVYVRSDSIFWGIGSGDTESVTYDWGFSLVPAYALEDHYFLGWAPGTSDATPIANGSPVYISSAQDDTEIFIDYSPTDGTADTSFTLDRLETQLVFDPDNENSGMEIWSTGAFVVAWGEDPDTASAGSPYLDLGYSTLPFFPDWMDLVLDIEKTADPTSLPLAVGQTSTFTIEVATFDFPVDDVDVFDTLPPGWDYVDDSTTITLPGGGTITGNPADPTISGQDLTWDINVDMGMNETLTVAFDGITNAGAVAGQNENGASARGTRLSGGQVFTPVDSAFVFLSPTGLTIDKDTSTPTVDPGTTATYSIVVANGGTSQITGLTIGDDLPTGFTFASAVISEVNATRTGVTNPSVGDGTLAWGTWDIDAAGSVTITFVVDVATGTALGTYDNTATADSIESGTIDDAGTTAQDPDTPSGQDPEGDEDVTVVDLLPTLVVTKTPGVSSIGEPGGSVTFTVDVENTSTEDVTLDTLTDDIFGNLNLQGSCATGGTIAAGDTYSCSFSGNVPGNAGDTHTNTTTAEISDDETNSETDSDDADVNITDVLPSLTVTKTADPTTIPEPGGNVDFDVDVENTSPEDVTLDTLTDDLFGNLNGQGTCSTVSITIAAGSIYSCSFTAAVAGNAGETHTNTTTAEISDDEGNTESDSDSAGVGITNVSSSISVTKNADPTGAPEPGATVTFTVQIDNTSTTDAVSITSLTDDVQGNLNGQGTCSVPQAIAVSGSYSCTFTATVSGSIGDTETNTVTASGTDDDGDPVSGDDDATVYMVGITKTLDGTNQGFTSGLDVAIGEIATYEVVLQIAPGTAGSMTLEDVLDLGLAFLSCDSITPSSGSLTTTEPSFASICSNPTVSEEPSGSVAAADQGRRAVFDFGDVGNPTGSVETLTVRYMVVVLNNADNLRGVALENDVTWSWSSVSSSASAPEAAVAEPTLSLVKAASPTSALPGTAITFTLTVVHGGATDADAFDLFLDDTLPAGLTYVAGSLSNTGGLAPTTLDDSGAPSLQITWATFPLATTSEITYQAVLGSLPAGSSISNDAFLQWSSLPGDVSAPQSTFNTLSTERFFDPGDPVNVYGLGTAATVTVTTAAVTAAAGLPDTGFAPGLHTLLPPQNLSYAPTSFELEIPTLGVRIPIMGIPLEETGWNLTWLWNQAGYLEGTAFPTWSGNTALTAHAYLPNGMPGPFVGLANLRWGQTVILNAYGLEYVYQVREVAEVKPTDLRVLGHRELDWLTLITCSNYDLEQGEYQSRTAVQAVLIDVRQSLWD